MRLETLALTLAAIAGALFLAVAIAALEALYAWDLPLRSHGCPMIKLRIEELPLGFGFRCINDNEYDGAPDAGPQMVGEGKTAEEAKADFMDQWMERESERDMNSALKQMRVWDSFLDQIFGKRP